ncbi:hypothetical protein IFM89_012262 [Coptis chinensis]|uniref:Uncharacterized protein n=1 Tax=Coptis chinensis TaxID=261450 RepID=A0A835LR58_9MAGN|nr:hypothetical protein IFM89_012262 [Coptis chinensis]
MDHSVIGVFCYNGGSLSIRIGLDSSIGGVAQKLHEKWPDLRLKCYNMCFNRDKKDNLIESDGELHSLACYCFAKKIAIVEIRVIVCVTSLITSSGSIYASSSSSSSALEFRYKLIEYSIVSGYKYELIKNDEDKPSLSLGDITSFYSREYELKISKHMSYAGKKLVLTELYGDVALSYNELLWYTKELKRRDLGNCVDLQEHMAELLNIGGDAVSNFLSRAPYDNWANAYFCGAWYGEMCSSLVECFNSWIDKEHHLPITAMLDEIRMKMMKMASDRRMECKNWKTIICPKMEVKLAERIEEACSVAGKVR